LKQGVHLVHPAPVLDRYNRVAKLIKQMEKASSAPNHVGKRKVLVRWERKEK